MSFEFSYRRYEPGDEDSINSLYQSVTGRQRSAEAFRWQWLSAPGGRAEIWLIEATDPSGRAQVIGHHGVMPVRFSNGPQDLLFGKTENTLVEPSFRKRILYPRFEKRFFDSYRDRFDAMFSTTGPRAAIRQRQAIGYSFPASFIEFYIGCHPLGNFTLGIDKIASRYLDAGVRRRINLFRSKTRLAKKTMTLLDADEAAASLYFDEFWPAARSRFGITPRRDGPDLNWRFWSNPYKSYSALVGLGLGGAPGYAVFSLIDGSPQAARIDDLVPHNPTAEGFKELLVEVRRHMNSLGFRWLHFTTTNDAPPKYSLVETLTKYELLLAKAAKAYRKTQGAPMPRRSSREISSVEMDLTGWYLSSIIMEGRD